MSMSLDVWLGVLWLLERLLQGDQRRSRSKWYVIEWLVLISRVFLFKSHIHCFLLLLLLFAFMSSHGKSTEGSSQAEAPGNLPEAHLRALKVQAPEVQLHQVCASVPALLVPLRALSSL